VPKKQVEARNNASAACHVIISLAELVSGSSQVPGARVDAQLQRALDYVNRATSLNPAWQPFDSTLHQYVGALRAASKPTQAQTQEIAATCESLGARAAPQVSPTT
jgi:hypothetical protein